MDLTTLTSNISKLIENCGNENAFANPVVIRAIDALVSMTIVSIVMCSALMIASTAMGPVGGVTFAVMTNVMSAMFNAVGSHITTMATSEC